jgi:hypothetical protein
MPAGIVVSGTDHPWRYRQNQVYFSPEIRFLFAMSCDFATPVRGCQAGAPPAAEKNYFRLGNSTTYGADPIASTFRKRLAFRCGAFFSSLPMPNQQRPAGSRSTKKGPAAAGPKLFPKGMARNPRFATGAHSRGRVLGRLIERVQLGRQPWCFGCFRNALYSQAQTR